MNAKNLQLLRYGLCPEPTAAVCLPSVSRCCGNVQLAGVTPEPFKEPNKFDFNGLSLSDAAYLGSFRHSDPLHRTDLLAGDYIKGAKLYDHVKEVGTDNVLQYFK